MCPQRRQFVGEGRFLVFNAAILPLLLWLLIMYFLPESVGFMLRQGDRVRRAMFFHTACSVQHFGGYDAVTDDLQHWA
jgi:hypothetical protein